MSLYNFQLRIVKHFCQVYDGSGSSGEDGDSSQEPQPSLRSPVHDPSTRLIGGYKRHSIELIPGDNKPQKRCRLCYRAGIRKDTRYHCKDCNVAVCTQKCFADYHSKTFL